MTIAINKNNLIEKLFLVSLATVIVALPISCGGRYGSLQIDHQQAQA